MKTRRNQESALQYSLFDDHLASGTSPRVSEELGAGSQFKYWLGTSGQKYLFSLISSAEIHDYAEKLGLIVNSKNDAVVWLGFIGKQDSKNPMPALKASHVAYVHLLPTDNEERDQAHNDLRTGIFSYIKSQDE